MLERYLFIFLFLVILFILLLWLIVTNKVMKTESAVDISSYFGLFRKST